MSQKPITTHLSSDRSIISGSEDLLGRADFVEGLANAFIHWRGEESLVVALYGPWGSGKTSVKNMVLESIKAKESRSQIIEFNPWGWSGQDRLMAAFFDEIGSALGRQPDAKGSDVLAKTWRKYAAKLKFTGGVIKAVKFGAQAIGVPIVPLVLEGAEHATDQLAELSESACKVHETADSNESLVDLKSSLIEMLRELEAPLLVVMDDVDRLTREEITLLFQLIKANADFPKVLYFVLFDRHIVEKALEEVGGDSGRNYMEKIVQAGFDLPHVDRSALDSMLFQGLDRVLSADDLVPRFDKNRWADMYEYGLKQLLNTPRDIKRFLSTYSFTVGLFFRNGTLEVNLIDFIGIEALRVFEPEVYRGLPSLRKLLVGTEISPHSSHDQQSFRRNQVKQVLMRARVVNQISVQHIVTKLFPPVASLLSGFGSVQCLADSWLRDLRVCHEDTFDRYFACTIPKHDVPQSTIESLLEVMSDRQSLCSLFSQLAESGRLAAVLKRLEAFTQVMNMAHVETFVTALMDSCDALPPMRGGFFGIDPARSAYLIIYNLLIREEDPVARGQILLSAVEATTGLYLPVQTVWLDDDRKKNDQQHRPTLLDEENSKKCRQLCARRLQEASTNGKLFGTKLLDYLWLWKHFAGERKPKAFVRKLSSTTEGALKVLRAVTTRASSIPLLGTASVSYSWGIDSEAIETFVNIQALVRSLKPVLGNVTSSEWLAIAADYANEIKAFQVFLQGRNSGETDGGSHV